MPGVSLSHQRLGPYELGELLGVGGMAEVYVAHRRGPRGFMKKVAVKRILPQHARDPRFVEMFCDEARICAALAHPNIVQVMDFGEYDGQLFMAMEYVDGGSLAGLLRELAERRQHFPLEMALHVAHQVLNGLAFAHMARDENGWPLRIVHRDVSPGNVLLGGVGSVKLSDFGIVRSTLVDRRTYPGELKGKVGYMSPEQVAGEEVDARSDLFSVGILLGEMLVGRPMFRGQSDLDALKRAYKADLREFERHATRVPDIVRDLVRRAMAREPARRFQTAVEFGQAIQRAVDRERLAWGTPDLVGWLAGLGLLKRSGVRESLATIPDR